MCVTVGLHMFSVNVFLINVININKIILNPGDFYKPDQRTGHFLLFYNFFINFKLIYIKN